MLPDRGTRAIDDPTKLLRAAQIVRAALARRGMRVEEPDGDHERTPSVTEARAA